MADALWIAQDKKQRPCSKKVQQNQGWEECSATSHCGDLDEETLEGKNPFVINADL